MIIAEIIEENKHFDKKVKK